MGCNDDSLEDECDRSCCWERACGRSINSWSACKEKCDSKKREFCKNVDFCPPSLFGFSAKASALAAAIISNQELRFVVTRSPFTRLTGRVRATNRTGFELDFIVAPRSPGGQTGLNAFRHLLVGRGAPPILSGDFSQPLTTEWAKASAILCSRGADVGLSQCARGLCPPQAIRFA